MSARPGAHDKAHARSSDDDADIDTDYTAEDDGPVLSTRLIAWVLTVGGVLGTAASFALVVEKFLLLANPFHIPSCTVDAVLSCGSVMRSPQAELFGFPNPVLGVIAFPVVTTLGVVLLAGARLPRWVWLGLQVGATLGVLFVHWLIIQSLYDIRALCPYCMVVWAVTIPVFWYTTVHNLDRGYLGLRTPLLVRFHSTVVTTWLLMIVLLVGQAFWAHWMSFF
ncbi:vitamin K epoxide reductase family protein [Allokutzneria sp. A3M-2-11 16]|uniref:vitamin K epoxide reductase family protein n=1 Tax=Allokutzneria sp. A3M-2-11 16 TaxID=2962043 RepID=UPI0020B788C2|nr:vitamin K epoxide reductase family protein [Allokutzneria sp. A3M-2-11 16]MCP3802527.1 vitamin K epoxide reductase family protein [Allokutzneria sp. A3M-2-11 16]